MKTMNSQLVWLLQCAFLQGVLAPMEPHECVFSFYRDNLDFSSVTFVTAYYINVGSFGLSQRSSKTFRSKCVTA